MMKIVMDNELGLGCIACDNGFTVIIGNKMYGRFKWSQKNAILELFKDQDSPTLERKDEQNEK
jgi:hypothetical protein